MVGIFADETDQIGPLRKRQNRRTETPIPTTKPADSFALRSVQIWDTSFAVYHTGAFCMPFRLMGSVPSC